MEIRYQEHRVIYRNEVCERAGTDLLGDRMSRGWKGNITSELCET